MTNTTEKRAGGGGRRAGAGRVQQRIRIDLETANILRELRRLRLAEGRLDVPEFQITPDDLVSDLIWGEAVKRGMLEPSQQAHWLAIARGEEPPATE